MPASETNTENCDAARAKPPSWACTHPNQVVVAGGSRISCREGLHEGKKVVLSTIRRPKVTGIASRSVNSENLKPGKPDFEKSLAWSQEWVPGVTAVAYPPRQECNA